MTGPVQRQGPVRVYLDQNKWIALAAANVGSPRATAEGAAALRYLRSQVSAGAVVCPIGIVHVWESNKAGRADRRAALADVMVELSDGNVLWPWHLALQIEAEHAVRTFLGHPQLEAPWIRAVGVGTEHLLGMPLRARDADGGPIPVPPKVLEYSRSAAALRAAIERPQEHAVATEDAETQATAEMEGTRAAARGAGVKKNRLMNDNVEQLYEYWTAALRLAVEQVGWAPTPTSAGPLPGSMEFFRSLPLIDAMATFTAWRDGEWSRSLDPNDLRDARWSDVAFAYCDVVIGEKYVVTCAQNSKLATRLEVGASRHLAELPDLVAAAGCARP